MPSILFVCTANQFRSPLAAAFLIKFIAATDSAGQWKVESAGTWTQPGLPAASFAVREAQQLGLPGLQTHLTREVNQEILDQFDLILVMEMNHWSAIALEFPSVSNRLKLLSEVVDGLPYDIPDPVSSKNDPKEVASELQTLIKKGGNKILKLAESLSHKHKEVG